MTNVTVLRTKYFNLNLAEKMLAARKNQRIIWLEEMEEAYNRDLQERMKKYIDRRSK